jgi:hypothetical protein
MRDDGATTPEHAQKMLKAETWGTDREIQRIAAMIRRQVTVVVMRPREGEEVVQVFTPEHHEGSITIVHRPGHFNSTEVVEWRLNERGRRCMKRAAVALFKQLAENGTGSGTQAVSVEAEAAAQCNGAE